MKLEDFIKEYVQKMYQLSLANDTFKFSHIRTKEEVNQSKLVEELSKIFSYNKDNSSFIVKIVNDFYQAEKFKTLLRFHAEIENFDYRKSSFELLEELTISLFNSNININIEFIRQNNFMYKLFDEYYYEQFVKLGKLDSIITSIDFEKTNCSYLESEVNPLVFNETVGVRNLIIDGVKKSYIKFFNAKLNTFLERSTIKMGNTNWYIENLDYGILNINNVKNLFKDENPEVLENFDTVFNMWYETEVIKASEKIMNIF